MSREGRSQPIQPFATHGFLGNVPANGVLPFPRSLVVEPEDRRTQGRRRPALDPIVGTHGFLGNTPANGVLPGPAVVVEPPRPRRLPEQPVAVNGLYTVTTAPAANPPAPTVIPLGERPRVTPPPQSSSGFDLVTPPAANVVEPKDRRRQTPDPVSLIGVLPFVRIPPPIVVENDRRRYPPLDPSAVNAALLAIQVAPQVDTPPGPFVVPIEERRHILERLRQPTSTHGFLGNTPANGVLPPPPSVVPPDLVVTSSVDVAVARGFVDTTPPPPPVAVQGGTDWAASIASFY